MLSQMTVHHDNSSEAAPQPDIASADTDSHLVPGVLTAELALIDLMARLIVDAVQRRTIQLEVHEP